MRHLTHEQFVAELNRQGTSGTKHAALKCPVCRTVQSEALMIREGCPVDDADTQIGFSCVGRWNGAGPAGSDGRPRAGKIGCDWTLGGLFKIHELEVTMNDITHPFFEVATPAEAQALERSLGE